MYFCNLVGTVDSRKAKGVSKVVLNVKELGDSTYLGVEEDTLVITSNKEKDTLGFLNEVDCSSIKKIPLNDYLKDTEENPVILVATSSIRVYEGCPVYFRHVYINDDVMLIALLSGTMDFADKDGEYISLARNINTNISGRKKKVVTPRDFINRKLEDVQSGYIYNKDVCSLCNISYKVSQKDVVELNFKYFSQGNIFLTIENLEKARVDAKLERDRKQVEKEKKEEENRLAMERYRLKELSKKDKEESKIKKDGRKSKNNDEFTSGATETDKYGYNLFAKSFMDAVNSKIKGED